MSYVDWWLTLFYILIIAFVAWIIKRRAVKKNPIYKYFLWGLFAKIIGAISMVLIYVYYYEGGDTLFYHHSATMLVDLLFESPMYFFQVLFSSYKNEYSYFFRDNYGILYVWENSTAFSTVKFVVLLELIGFKSYLTSSVLMAVLSFTGVWKLYVIFCECYPKLYKQFAWSILFIPSVVFWGSGILKDSFTLAAVGWYVYSFHRIFIGRKVSPLNILSFIVSISVMVLIKPYIFIGLLPGSILWMIWSRLLKIRNVFLRIFIAPLITCIGIFIGYSLWVATSDNLGQYSDIDSIVRKAYVSYSDLKMEHYHGNSFDLGDYDPTLSGMLSKFPQAVNAGLFRPYLWQAKNWVMVISGIENLFSLSLTLFFLIRRPLSFINTLFSNPLVLFSIIFGVFFAFSVAISTSNFGAMVRLRIPALPFFLSGILLIEYLRREKTLSEELNNGSKT